MSIEGYDKEEGGAKDLVSRINSPLLKKGAKQILFKKNCYQFNLF